MLKLLKNIFSIEENVTHKIYKILGIKIRVFKYNKKLAQTVELMAREVYSALEVSKLHTEVFTQFKNCNRGKYITIIGCGPTIAYYNNEADYINIALNKALTIENINFAYSFAFDNGILTTCPEYMELLKKRSGIKFIGKFLHSEFDFNFPEIDFPEQYHIYRYFGGKRHGLPSCKKFEYELHTDITTYPLADFYSISFAALHFALFTNPKKIFLVGLDTSNNGQFFDKESGYHVKAMIEGYKRFKNFIKTYYPNTEIISVNPVGLKGLFKDVYTENYLKANPNIAEEITQDGIIPESMLIK